MLHNNALQLEQLGASFVGTSIGNESVCQPLPSLLRLRCQCRCLQPLLMLPVCPLHCTVVSRSLDAASTLNFSAAAAVHCALHGRTSYLLAPVSASPARQQLREGERDSLFGNLGLQQVSVCFSSTLCHHQHQQQWWWWKQSSGAQLTLSV